MDSSEWPLPDWVEQARRAIWQDFSQGRLDEDTATARLLSLDLDRRTGPRGVPSVRTPRDPWTHTDESHRTAA